MKAQEKKRMDAVQLPPELTGHLRKMIRRVRRIILLRGLLVTVSVLVISALAIMAVDAGTCLIVIVEMPGRDCVLISSIDLSSLIFRSSGLETNSSTFEAVAPGKTETSMAVRCGMVGSSCWPSLV